MPPREPHSTIDTIADFDRAIEEIPPEMASSMRHRQQDVASKRDQAQMNEDLLRLRMHGTGHAVE